MNTILIIGILVVTVLLIYSYKDTYKEYFWFLSTPEKNCVGDKCELPKKKILDKQEINEDPEEKSVSTSNTNTNTYETNTPASGSIYSNSEYSNLSSQISNGSFLSKNSDFSGDYSDDDISSNHSISSSFLND